MNGLPGATGQASVCTLACARLAAVSGLRAARLAAVIARPHGWAGYAGGMKPTAALSCVCAVLLLASCAQGPSPAAVPTLPPGAAGPATHRPAAVAASTAHPLATQAALQAMAAGGSAADALVAAQAVLGLVEPQSSGFGGGALVLLWEPATRQLHSYDGLAAAPVHTTASLRTDTDGRLLPVAEVSRGGRSVGVPGAPALLHELHARHGRLPWSRLFEPAMRLAREGHPLAPYAARVLAQDAAALRTTGLAATHFNAEGQPLPAGTLLRQPAYAATLEKMAALGMPAWLAQGGAEGIAAAARRGAHPSLMTPQDVLAYRPKAREPVCAPVLAYRVCTAGPPSFGGVAVLQMLQMLELKLGGAAPDLSSPAFWHTYAEAGRLAQADRRFWVGDPDHTAVPVAGLVARPYLAERAALIEPARALPKPERGRPALAATGQAAAAGNVNEATSQLVVVDAAGRVASMTTTNNLNFGSRVVAGGVVLNNAMTNFTDAPPPGQRLANQMAPSKRPITSMAPLIVFDAAGQPVLAGGSAGGGQIVDYIARALVQMLWLQHSPAQALAPGHVSTALAPKVQLEQGSPREALAPALRALGHEVEVVPLPSGAGFLQRRGAEGWVGAADPRRDGVASGL